MLNGSELSPEGRAAYIAGTFDSLVDRYDDDAGRTVALHYLECLARAKIGSNQLGDNLQTYVQRASRVAGRYGLRRAREISRRPMQ